MNTEDGALFIPLEADNKEFISAIQEAERRVKGFSDATASEGAKINKTLTEITKESVKMTNSFNKESKREKGLIEDLENALSELKEKKRQAFTTEDISKYNQKIQEAEINLKEYNETGRKTVETHNEQEKSQNRIIESLKKWGLGLLTITGAVKVFKEIIASSDVATENFRFTIDGLKGALQQLSQALIPSAGQTGRVVENMIEGFKNAKELSKALDAYNDSLKSSQVLEDKEIKQLKELETVWRNGSVEIDTRKEKLQEWIKIKQEAAARELEIERKLNDAIVLEIQKRPNLVAENLKREQIERFAAIYATNSELMQKAEEYWSQKQKLSLRGEAVGFTDEQTKYYANLKKEIEALIPVGSDWNEIMNMAKIHASLNTDQMDALRESFSRLYKAQAGGSEIEAEVARWMGSLENKASKAAKEIDDLTKQINDLKIKMIDAGDAERKGIALKILVLEKELKLREDIVRQTILAASIAEMGVPGKISASFSTPSVLPQIKPKKTVQQLWQDLQEDMGKLRPDKTAEYTEKFTEKERKRREEITKHELERRDRARELVGYMGELTINLEQQGVLTADTARQMEAMVNIAGNLLSGNLPGAAMALLENLLVNIKETFPGVMAKEAQRLEMKISEINRLLDEQRRLIGLSGDQGGGISATKGEGDLIQRQINENEAAIKRYEKIRDSIWRSQKKKNEAIEEIAKLREENKQLQYELEDSKEALEGLFFGADIERSVANALIAGLESGKIGADDYAEYLNGVLKQAIINSMLDQTLLPKIAAEFLPMLNKAMDDGEINNEEREAAKKWMADTAEMLKPWGDALNSMFPSESLADKSLTASIKGASESTVSAVAGQMNAVRIGQADANLMIRQQLMHLAEIASNTRFNKYLTHLESIDSKISGDTLRAQGLS